VTAFDVVTARLTERTGGTGRNGTWPCPAHDDRNPSLSVSQGNEGVVLYCHAGCTTEDVVAALGLTMADLFDTPKSNASDIVATYDYTDENGTLLFQVVRFTGKKFRQRRPDGQGGWIWKLGDTRRVLYRLPKVIKGVADGATIFIVEGEKDADRLAAGGYVATCNPHGAGKWRSGYNATLEGADVVIVADRDDTGHAHARDVAWNLDGVAALVRVVEAAEGKDVSDHLAAGRSVEELVIADVSGWPQPTPLGVSTGLPSFPVDALPDWVRDHVQAIAEFTQTPVDLPACVALAVLATAVGGRVKVQVRGPWIEPTNLFTVTALPPGSRKSAVFSAMTKPLLLAETALVEKVEPKNLEVETMIKITEAELKRAREGAAKADTTRVREEKRDEAMTLGEVRAALRVRGSRRTPVLHLRRASDLMTLGRASDHETTHCVRVVFHRPSRARRPVATRPTAGSRPATWRASLRDVLLVAPTQSSQPMQRFMPSSSSGRLPTGRRTCRPPRTPGRMPIAFTGGG
jgi:putative DNA primase/helicase